MRFSIRGYKKIVLAIAGPLALLLLFAYLYYRETEHQRALERAAQQSLDVESDALEARSAGTREIHLYFFEPDSLASYPQGPAPEKHSIFETHDPVLNARQIINEVIKGSESRALRLFSENARLRQVYLLEDGTAIVDLSAEASREMVGGVVSELCSLYSLTRSLIENVEEIKRVRFVVEGSSQPTLAGHVSIREPFM